MDPLMQALQYTDDDLKANQQGRIGPFQAVRLKRTLTHWIAVSAIVLILGVLGAASFLYFGAVNASSGLTLTGIVITVFNAIVVGLIAQFWMRSRTDLQRPPLVQEGVLHRVVRATKNGRFAGYIMRLEGVSGDINVNKLIFNAFADGARYRLYRAAGSRTLLSAEVVVKD
ncbi:MAG: hypothetical protein JNL34_17785 [Anaerolineae bacterium]|nr:hypothetical protein [Anaerolineae bacterium]